MSTVERRTAPRDREATTYLASSLPLTFTHTRCLALSRAQLFHSIFQSIRSRTMYAHNEDDYDDLPPVNSPEYQDLVIQRILDKQRQDDEE